MCKDINTLIDKHRRRLQKLKEQQALRGLDTPPHILIEIEDIEVEIEKLQTASKQVKGRGIDGESQIARRVEHLSEKLQKIEQEIGLLRDNGERSDDEVERRRRLKSKLKRLRKLGADCPFAIVGSVYLDIILRPIDTKKLEPVEWSNIDPIKVEWGGSSLHVSKYLWDKFRKKSRVFSMIGCREDDPLTDTFDRLIKKENWLNAHFEPGHRNTSTAVTVHLKQIKDEFTTMFTQPGALTELGWGVIKTELIETLKKGGVLYISGYLKTNLHYNLSITLGELSKEEDTLKSGSDSGSDVPPSYSREETSASSRSLVERPPLVCVDHGRLSRFVNPAAVSALREAFELDLVDVYFCTLDELWRFCYFDDTKEKEPPKPLDPAEVMQILKEISENHHLPLITIVRDSRLPGRTNKAYALIGSAPPCPLKGANKILTRRDIPHPRNAFTAAMIYNLIYYDINSDKCDTLEELVNGVGSIF